MQLSFGLLFASLLNYDGYANFLGKPLRGDELFIRGDPLSSDKLPEDRKFPSFPAIRKDEQEFVFSLKDEVWDL